MTSAAPLPSGVVTFLLTDIEGSTALWDRHGEAMAMALERHDVLVAAAVTDAGGRLIKSKGEGDSTFSVFQRTSDAAVAALAILQALAAETWPEGIVIRSRLSIHMGEAVERDGDYYGPAVNRVARLRGLANGGEIMLSRSAAEVIADQAGDAFTIHELGEASLKGISRPEHVFQLVPSGQQPRTSLPVASAPAPVNEVPPSLTGGPFVGRHTEIDAMRAAWERACRGRPRAVLIGGEPGIGKTSLCGAFAREAFEAGATVVYGRCDEDLGVAFQPFAEALRTLIGTGCVQLADIPNSGQLVRLVPELRDLVPEVTTVVNADAEADRWALFEAVDALLAAASEHAPVLLVIDDLHWAAKPTLLLLRHLLRTDRVARLLVITTYRDTEAEATKRVNDFAADLRRDALGERLAVTGLDTSDVEALVAVTAGHALDERAVELSGLLRSETGGNPFFIAETLRHLVESGAIFERDGRWTSDLELHELDLADGVREVLDRRIDRLTETTVKVLTVGALIGPTFNVRLLEAAADVDPDALLDGLDEAVAAGMLTETPGDYAFNHALIRHALLGRLGGTRKMRMHRRIGEAIEAMPSPNLHIEALAHHFSETAFDGQVAKASRYGLAAGRRAMERLALEDAIEWLERSLSFVDAEPDDHREVRADVLTELARVRSVIGPRGTGRDYALRAGQEALLLEDLPRFTAAAAMGGRFGQVGRPDEALLDLLRAGMAIAEHDDPLTWAQLAAELSFMVGSNGEGNRAAADELTTRALAIARASDDSGVLGRALSARVSNLLGTPHVDQWRPLAQEILGLKETLEDSFVATFGLCYLACADIMSGDRVAFESATAQMEQLEQTTKAWYPGYFLRSYRCVSANLAGRWDEAAAALDDLFQHGADDPNMLNVWQANQMVLARETGQLADMLPLIEATALMNPGVAGYAAASTLFLGELGRHDEAKALLAPVKGPEFASLPDDQVFPMTLGCYAEGAAYAGDCEAAAVLAEALGPFTGLLLAPAAGTICMGSADRILAMLHTTLGAWDQAEVHFARALEIETGFGSVVMEARTRAWRSRMLLARREPGDEDLARVELDTAHSQATAMGMVMLVADIERMLAEEFAGSVERPTI